MIDSKSHIQKKLIAWFRKNQRQLPWRDTDNWYYIWVSEIMLQQTQVDQVIPYFIRFIKKFSTVQKLAAARQESVLKSWEGLGYYSRARNLHQSAKILVQSYGGQLPDERNALQQLPGFGPYTTNAVLSLAFNQPYAVVDGNIKRVISRLFAVDDDMRKTAGQKKIQALMDELLPKKQSRLFNEAVMEIGALICLPVNPHCQKCPLSRECIANQTAMQGQLPYLSKKAQVPKIRSFSFIVHNGDHLLVVKRPSRGMLAGLWEFPILKLDNSKTDGIPPEQLLLQNFGLQASFKKIWEPITHSYSHFHLNLQAVLLTTTKKRIRTNSYHSYRWLLLNELKKYPLHRAVWKIIDKIKADLIAIAN